MDRLKRAALVTRLADQLRNKGSWCGETHIQKAVYFLQVLTEVPLDFEFILYKHGPFSFDLRDELTSLRADELIELEVQLPYGPRIISTKGGEYIQKNHEKTLAHWNGAIEFVVEKLGGKDVVDLERLATALFVTKSGPEAASVDERAAELTRLKPHIKGETAIQAVTELDGIVQECTI